VNSQAAATFLAGEAESLLTRLDGVRSFSLTIAMVPAVAASTRGLRDIEGYLATGRTILRSKVLAYLKWIRGPGAEVPVDLQQRRLTFLKLQFNAALDQLDIFADALVQRGEHEHGIWLAGLDAVAADVLTLRETYFVAPAMITYLDRGHGAAIRRARTRLPGGGESPAAVIRIPRERMVGGGIGASLVHEVGHQASALLDLNNSIRRSLERRMRVAGCDRATWNLWSRWINEIIADTWAVAHLGACGTMGLIAVVGLPRAFVFRVQLDDPHPFPWIRVKLSCVLGQLLFPDPQWKRIDAFWEAAYPRAGLPPAQLKLLERLEATAPELGLAILKHRPRSLRGRALIEVLPLAERTVPRLRRLFTSWRDRTAGMCTSRPSLALAVLGQARVDGRLSAREEATTLARLMAFWAERRIVTNGGAAVECERQEARWSAA